MGGIWEESMNHWEGNEYRKNGKHGPVRVRLGPSSKGKHAHCVKAPYLRARRNKGESHVA